VRVTQLPYEVEAMLRRDLHSVHRHIEELLLGGRANHRVVVPGYLTPKLDSSTVHKTDEHGELRHYHRVRNVLEYIFEHDGKIREKYRPLLTEIHAPQHVTALVAD
jgi:hypothetical protein